MRLRVRTISPFSFSATSFLALDDLPCGGDANENGGGK